MRYIWHWAVALAVGTSLVFGCSAARAEEDATTPIGRTVVNFSLPNVYGKNVALDDFKDKVVVLAFIGTECPMARSYAPRLRDLAGEFEKQGVVFLAVDSNMQDSLSELATFARQMNLSFPVLKDNNNELADHVGAIRTPEVFVLDREHTIRYWGRIDDQYGFKTGAGYAKPQLNERNLVDALGEVLAGKPVSRPVVKAEGCFIGRVAKTAPHGEVTYANQVARVLQDRCVECHRKGEVAPFTLTSYEDAIGWAETVREVVSEGRMPPWFADPRFGHFSNDSRLSAAEKQTLTAWVENGCPQGDLKDLPAARQFVEGWRIGTPDQVFSMSDKAYKVPAEGTVPYVYYGVETGWKEDRWIAATEARPGNRAVVHHIIVTALPAGSRAGGDALAGGLGLAGYAPGTVATVCEPSTAIFVPANSMLSFQMHYTTNGVEQEDLSMVGVKFADPSTVKQMRRGGALGDLFFRIPPGNSNYEVKAMRQMGRDTLLLSLTPHMHLRGKNFRFEAEFPDGTREVLLDVPNYDFNWQLTYMLEEPRLLPKGTRLHGIAHFDNSTENGANPDSKQTVTWGEQTWEEMMFGFYSSLDPNEDLLASAKPGKPTLEKGEVGGVVGEGSINAANARQFEGQQHDETAK